MHGAVFHGNFGIVPPQIVGIRSSQHGGQHQQQQQQQQNHQYGGASGIGSGGGLVVAPHQANQYPPPQQTQFGGVPPVQQQSYGSVAPPNQQYGSHPQQLQQQQYNEQPHFGNRQSQQNQQQQQQGYAGIPQVQNQYGGPQGGQHNSNQYIPVAQSEQQSQQPPLPQQNPLQGQTQHQYPDYHSPLRQQKQELQSNPSPFIARAIKNFDGEGESTLHNVKMGDILRIIEIDRESEWWGGHKLEDSAEDTGWLPECIVERLSLEESEHYLNQFEQRERENKRRQQVREEREKDDREREERDREIREREQRERDREERRKAKKQRDEELRRQEEERRDEEERIRREEERRLEEEEFERRRKLEEEREETRRRRKQDEEERKKEEDRRNAEREERRKRDLREQEKRLGRFKKDNVQDPNGDYSSDGLDYTGCSSNYDKNYNKNNVSEQRGVTTSSSGIGISRGSVDNYIKPPNSINSRSAVNSTSVNSTDNNRVSGGGDINNRISGGISGGTNYYGGDMNNRISGGISGGTNYYGGDINNRGSYNNDPCNTSYNIMNTSSYHNTSLASIKVPSPGHTDRIKKLEQEVNKLNTEMQQKNKHIASLKQDIEDQKRDQLKRRKNVATFFSNKCNSNFSESVINSIEENGMNAASIRDFSDVKKMFQSGKGGNNNNHNIMNGDNMNMNHSMNMRGDDNIMMNMNNTTDNSSLKTLKTEIHSLQKRLTDIQGKERNLQKILEEGDDANTQVEKLRKIFNMPILARRGSIRASRGSVGRVSVDLNDIENFDSPYKFSPQKGNTMKGTPGPSPPVSHPAYVPPVVKKNTKPSRPVEPLQGVENRIYEDALEERRESPVKRAMAGSVKARISMFETK